MVIIRQRLLLECLRQFFGERSCNKKNKGKRLARVTDLMEGAKDKLFLLITF